MTEANRPVVLIVDDEPQLAELFELWLRDSWDVRTAFDGETALELVDDDVAIVLLDRRMPGLSGDEVLDSIRDRGYDCQVVMITAVDPDFDIVEMGFDGYIVKPISRTELREVVEQIYQQSDYDRNVREYFGLISKKVVLESEKSPTELTESEEYAKLERQIEEAKARADSSISGVEGHEGFKALFQRVSTDESNGV